MWLVRISSGRGSGGRGGLEEHSSGRGHATGGPVPVMVMVRRRRRRLQRRMRRLRFVTRALRRIGPASVVMMVMVMTLAGRTLPVHQLVAGVPGRFTAGTVAPGMVMVVVVMAVVMQRRRRRLRRRLLDVRRRRRRRRRRVDEQRNTLRVG